jgi:hypothetical protein
VRKYYDEDSAERAFKQMRGIPDLRPERVWLKSIYWVSCEDMPSHIFHTQLSFLHTGEEGSIRPIDTMGTG